jgi:threonine aldolase
VYGLVARLDYIKSLKKIAKKNKLLFHLDGARAWNAAAFLKIPMSEYLKDFDMASLCMSKGMGAPMGSVLVGSKK